MESKEKNGPLLYIEQPTLTTPKVKMQTIFHTKKPNLKRGKQDKSFKDCSIEEKVQYLLHLPKGLLHVTCEVVTKEENYRGILIKEDKDYITVQSHGRREKFILKSTITDIHLISL